jgi:hypothetical protein
LIDRSIPIAKSGANHVLDDPAANRAAELRPSAAVSAVDATVGHVAETSAGPVAILTSDAGDMRRLAGLVDGDVRVIQL